MINRLKLDFSLTTNEERNKFINQYINEEQFQKIPLTPDELEMIGNYILWGKDPKTNLNFTQTKEIQIETKNKTWSTQKKEESYEALLEMPGFTEQMIRSPQQAVLKVPREVFSRSKARAQAPPHILELFQELWQKIDRVDLLINFYDLAHNKRKNPPRESLLQLFTEEEIQQIKEEASHLNQFTYLKKRHLLVELRREQFSLRDMYSTPITRHFEGIESIVELPTIDVDIAVFPLGLKYGNNEKLFPKIGYPKPQDFSEKEINKLIKEYWNKQNHKQSQFFDFKDLEHVYNLFLLFDEVYDDTLRKEILSTSSEFLNTLNFYIDHASLSDIQKEILELKLQHKLNQYIADYINKKYEKTYNANYISTIFRKKIIPQINNAARYHEEILLSLPYPENFKKCSKCGETLLICADNFVKKSRSQDGFTNICKRCEKKKRDEKKEKKNDK